MPHLVHHYLLFYISPHKEAFIVALHKITVGYVMDEDDDDDVFLHVLIIVHDIIYVWNHDRSTVPPAGNDGMNNWPHVTTKCPIISQMPQSVCVCI